MSERKGDMGSRAWDDARRYWETLADDAGSVDLELDPDGLSNVCWPGQPLWLNRYLAEQQARSFSRLLKELPSRRRGRALDLGCGAARWSTMLADNGWDVTGIDLQATLIEANSLRFPGIEFMRISIQDFDPPGSFDLISSVTVIQHNPWTEQEEIVEKIGALLDRGGHAVVLESLRGRGDHMYPRPIDGWLDLFQRHGMSPLEIRPYDHSPFLHGALGLWSWLRRRREGSETTNVAAGSRMPMQLRERLLHPLLRLSVALDRPLDKRLEGSSSRLPATHCGFVFERDR